MDTKQYRTIVFEITDPQKAAEFLKPMIQALGEPHEIAPGVRVTGVSLRDEITAVEQLENDIRTPWPEGPSSTATVTVEL
ncbi:hypothetical protein [Xanthomonas arboricola]|uniref:Uncharacterized protein n=1 Tax=Xanthomonas arboricola TaxID=56448 RepID=A0AB73H1T3_9XANT|nr:hypothetical protein [Xanthomonas arboricola]MBB5672350.1 hypothetical protein [Xanthomonas arboricola]